MRQRGRLFYLIKKEFIQLKRDKRLLPMLILMPLIQLVIIGYVFSTDVKNIGTSILDESGTAESRAFISAVKSAGYFVVDDYADGRDDLMAKIENGDVRVGLVIPADYAAKLSRGETAEIEALIDGSDPNTGGVALSYISRIAQAKGMEIKVKQLGGREIKPLLDSRIRILFNPEMKSVDFMIPGLIAMLLMLVTTLLASASVVREREHGTMEHLIVMPVRKWELIIGKLLPFVVFGFLDVLLIVLVGTLWFKVPFRGNLAELFVLSTLFIFTNLGVGLFVSTTARTQQQAMLTAYFIALPTMILSGLIFPIENMPETIQALSYVFPLRYFLVIVRSIFLKGSNSMDMWRDIALLAAYGMTIISLSVWRFQKKLS
jgi:ABC-2 type transport system permease protein